MSLINNLHTSLLNRFFPKNPESHKRELQLLPEFCEHAFGTLFYRTVIYIKGGPYRGSKNYQSLINRVGYRLAAHSTRVDLPYDFTVIRSKEINAWCLTGGKIAIYTGLIKELKHEKRSFGIGHFSLKEKLAAVLSHEITHTTACHHARIVKLTLVWATIVNAFDIVSSIFIRKNKDFFNKRVFSCLNSDLLKAIGHTLILYLSLARSSRLQELEADKGGIYNMVRAGYNPRAVIWLQKMALFHYEEDNGPLRFFTKLFSSHPDISTRIRQSEEIIAAINLDNE